MENTHLIQIKQIYCNVEHLLSSKTTLKNFRLHFKFLSDFANLLSTFKAYVYHGIDLRLFILYCK
jgi:hypothetical protein